PVPSMERKPASRRQRCSSSSASGRKPRRSCRCFRGDLRDFEPCNQLRDMRQLLRANRERTTRRAQGGRERPLRQRTTAWAPQGRRALRRERKWAQWAAKRDRAMKANVRPDCTPFLAERPPVRLAYQSPPEPKTRDEKSRLP